MANFVYVVLGCLLALVPLVFSPRSSELFEFPKMLLIYFGASLLLPLVLYRLKEKRLYRSTYFKLTLLAAGAFLAGQVASSFFSIDPWVSVFGYYSRFNGGLLSLGSYLTIMLAGYAFLNRERVLNLLKLTWATGLVVALWGLPSHFGYDFICLLVQGSLSTKCWSADFIPELRMFATLGQPNWLASYLLVLIFITLFLLTTGLRLKNKIFEQYSKYLLLFSFVLFSIELVWTNSKSGILTFIVLFSGYLLTQLWLKQKEWVKWQKNQYWLPIVALVVITLLQAFPLITRLLQETGKANTVKPTTSVTNKSKPVDHITPSSTIRLIVWEGAVKVWQRYPWIGSGVETFAYSYPKDRPQAHNLTSEWNFTYNKAHNELLNYLATSGTIGLVTYLLFFGTLLMPAIINIFSQDEETKEFSLSYLFAMASIFAMNFLGFSTTMTSLLTYLLPGLYLVYLQHATTLSETKETQVLKKVTVNQLAVYFIWVLFTFVYLLNYFSADYAYARGREYKQLSDFNNAYLQTQKAIDLRREPTYLDQQAVVAANLAALSQIQKQNPQVKELTRLAKQYSAETIAKAPQNVVYYKTRAKIYYLLALTNLDSPETASDYHNQAIRALEVAQSLAPTDPVIPYTLATLVVEKDQSRALALARLAIDLKPDYREAQDLVKQLQNN